MKKYGLIIDEQKPEDFVFGASLPMEIINESGDWHEWLPNKEIQNLNGVEPYACVIYTILNCAETLIKKQYGEERNYSDRFLATVVGTRGKGCSPKDACQFLRKVGVVPQDVWPFDESVTSEEVFFTPPSPKLYELAQDFNKEWDFGYEIVPSNPASITAALKCSPLLMSVPAWTEQDGKFFRPDGQRDNHATSLFYELQEAFRRVFDSYDAPHIKDVEWGCMPSVVFRFRIKKRHKEPESWWKILLDIIKKLFKHE